MTEKKNSPLINYMINNPEAFAQNLTRIMQESGKALSAYLEPREKGENKSDMTSELGEVVKTLGRVGEYWVADPKRAMDAQSRLWTEYMQAWNSTLHRLAGEPSASPSTGEPDPADKRFKDHEWQDNEFFNLIKQFYLITARWADSLVEEAEDLDDHTRHKADFYIKQIANALAPTNFILTNPELLRETFSSNAENLAVGMKMLAEDIEAGGGDLKLRQTDASKFAVGENLAMSPGKVIAQNEVCQVLQYEPTTAKVLKRPLLIVPPWINKFYILDLTPEKSFIKWAVAQGHTVFVVSWVNPDERLAEKSFEHYIKEGILHALDTVEAATGEKGINAIGYCVGGTLLSAALAYMVKKRDRRVKSATFFTTQVDFTHAGDLQVFVDEEQIAAVEKRMAERGYLEGKKMATAFNMLRSNDLIWPYVVNTYLRGKEPFPFDLLYWNSDSTRMPAANHSFYLRNCYLENKLTGGEMIIDNTQLDLSKVKIPVYNLATREDHIAPAKSVFVGSQYFGGPVKYVMAGSGHIAGVVNPPSKNKYQYWTDGPAKGDFETWVKNAVETPGSWWPDWDGWIKSLDDTEVKARKPGDGNLKPIEDAPGSYVLVQS